uniref:SAWADEE domain-containing protein n=1 Tax=Ananas comosus var. bracteatus TaxID=296719 RepID=A0A6V7PT02_ANACO|nr:unnamed protein product [Ananas comosus var. bracteatus]
MGGADHGRTRRNQTPRFSSSEIKQMEKLLLEKKDELLDESFCQQLTEKFNLASGRCTSRAIQMKQVQEWFKNKLRIQVLDVPSSPSSSEERTAVSETSLSNNALPNTSDMPKGRSGKSAEGRELEFEARSSRDGAWYDVATFLAHRVLSSGELEVKVRFQGFGADDDEWVNVKEAVRERSIPLESSECTKVAVGDLVLCFRERNEEATYFDAHVIEIERKLHDIRGCRCVFLIKYDHDKIEEKVQLRRLCRRPTY